MRMDLRQSLSIAVVMATLGLSGTPGWSFPGSAGPFTFSGTEYTDNFTDLRRGTDINDDGAPDLGGTGHTALNFTGGAGPAGDLWLTAYSGPDNVFDGAAGICVFADVLIHTYNNTKGAGPMALFNTESGLALAAILYDQGNSDALQLATVDPATGKIGKLASIGLGSNIAENAWYRVFLFVSGATSTTEDDLHAQALVFKHAISTDPTSNPLTQVGGTLIFDGTLSGTGLFSVGAVGIAASAYSTNVNSSVTNWSARDGVRPEECQPKK